MILYQIKDEIFDFSSIQPVDSKRVSTGRPAR